MKDKWRAFDFPDEPSRDPEQERRRNEHINIGAGERERAQGGGKDETRFVKNALQSGDARRNKMPAAMHRNSVDLVGAIKLSAILGPLFPGRIIGKTRDHRHVVSLRVQELAERDVVRRDPGKLRRVVDPPDDDAHRVYSSGARSVLVSS